MRSFMARRSSHVMLGIVALLAIAQAIFPGGLTPTGIGNQALALIAKSPPVSSAAPTATVYSSWAPPSTEPPVTGAMASVVTPDKASPSSVPDASPAASLGTFSSNPANKLRDNGIILAYYVPYDPTSWQSLQAHADTIDFVAPQWVDIDACGDVGSRDDNTLVTFARGKGLRIVPSLLTGSQELNHRLLGDAATSRRAIQQLVAYIVDGGYDGLDLDLENISPADRHEYTVFVQGLSTALRNNHKLLTAAIPAKTFDATTGWAGAYDYAAIAPYFDLVTIMTYEYSSPAGKPGSIAPVDWVDNVIAYVASQFPPKKVLVGLAFYGYDWNVTTGDHARSLRNLYASSLAQKFGATVELDPATKSATFSYTLRPGETPPPDEKLPALNHQIFTRPLPSCSATLPTPTPTKTAPTPRPTPAGDQTHVVWIEDASAVLAHLQIVSKYGVAGIGTWRLGQEDPVIWPDFREWRSTGN